MAYMKELGPYIGITGFESMEQLDWCTPYLGRIRNAGYKLMAGIMVCDLTLRGYSAPWPQYPRLAALSGIQNHAPAEILLTAHYNRSPKQMGAISGHESRPILVSLADDLSQITKVIPTLNALQLNFIPPNPTDFIDTLEAARRCIFKKMITIVSAGSNSTAPETLLGHMRRYEYMADYILIDSSYGKGIQINETTIQAAINALRPASWRLTIAGGLGAKTLRESSFLRGLLRQDPRVSFDAQGKLRGENGVISRPAVEAYLEAALDVVG
jgi:phosphoribosylanthranilate isomerase